MQPTIPCGSTRSFTRVVQEKHLAGFDEGGVVHRVYSTFDLVRDAEWACRQFVLEMREEHEEGMGISVTVEHVSPAPVGSTVVITSTLEAMKGTKLTCSFVARVGERVIGRGSQVQIVLPRSRIKELFDQAATSGRAT